MAKKKLLLIPLFLAIVAMFGILMTACKSGDKFGIKWEVSQYATVTVEGYDELPDDIEADGTLSFKVSAATGYEISAVRVNDRPVNADKNGVYSTVVKADITVTVEATEKISSVTVKTNPTKLSYYAGEVLDTEGMEVEVKYATNRTEIVDDFSVVYPSADGKTFALGNTSFSVKYKGVESASVELDGAVKALVTLNLNNGQFTQEQLAALSAFDDYNYDMAKGLITWTYGEATESDFVLPQPTLPVEGVNFPFLRWGGDGIEKYTTIPAGSTTSIVATATYETRLVELFSIGFETATVTETAGEGDDAKEVEVTVVYLVIKGEFKAASEAYLFLYEGNDPPVSLVGPTFKKASDTDEFTLKFDMRELVKTGYDGKWMDIKFCSKIGTTTFTQEIDLNNYENNFISGKNAIYVVESDTQMTTYSFTSYTPDKDEAIKGTDGETYVGNEKLLKVYYHVSAPADYILDDITLELKDGKPYLVIPGFCVVIDSKEKAETALAGLIKDMQNLSNWADQNISQSIVVNNDLTFEVRVCLENVTTEGFYIMHSASDNFNPANYDKEVSVTVNGYKYSLGAEDFHGWGWTWFGVRMVDTDKVTLTPTNISLVSENDGAYLVISGSHAGTQAQASAYLGKILTGVSGNDLQNMTAWSYGCFNANGDNPNTLVTATEDSWTLKIDLAKLGLTNALHNFHFTGADVVDTDALTVVDGTVTAGGKTYKLDVQNHWDKDRPILEVTDAE